MLRRLRSAGQDAPADAPEPAARPPLQPWRKVLWARQEGYDDAHTSESFLQELVVNATVPHREYATVVWSSLVVDQQLATVALVGSTSQHLYQGTIKPRQLLLADALLMLLGAVLYLGSAAWAAAQGIGAGCNTVAEVAEARRAPATTAAAAEPSAGAPHTHQAPTLLASPSKQRSSRQRHDHASPGWWPRIADGVSSLAALVAATALLSPLLGTLTETVSSDTIIACACLLLVAHLYLHDYHFAANLTAQLSGSLALGCAVCGSVLIASRLGSPEAVFAQLLLSLELYILGPYCRRQVAATSRVANLALTAAMVAAAARLLAPLSVLLTSSFCCAVLFVTLLCPMWLVRIHKFKAAINGPWDEAVPRLSAAVTRHLSRQ